MKTNIYVDGFNLYYGCLKRTPYKWLNIQKLCELILPYNEIHFIKYFTAKVKSRLNNPNIHIRQDTYLRALRTIPILEIHYGHYLEHQTKMRTLNGNPRYVDVIKTEEKGSDVNLASHLLLDAFENKFEVAIIISNDSDLVTPIKIVREKFNKPVGILNPHKKPSHVLTQNATFIRSIRKGPLEAAQFPKIIEDATGKFKCPERWDLSSEKL